MSTKNPYSDRTVSTDFIKNDHKTKKNSRFLWLKEALNLIFNTWTNLYRNKLAKINEIKIK